MKLFTLTKEQLKKLPDDIALYRTGDVCSVIREGDTIIRERLPESLVNEVFKRAADKQVIRRYQSMQYGNFFEKNEVKYSTVLCNCSIAALLNDDVIDRCFQTEKEPVCIFVKSPNEAYVVPESKKNVITQLASEMSCGMVPTLSAFMFRKEHGKSLEKVSLQEAYRKYQQKETPQTKQEPKTDISENAELNAYRATGLTPEDIEAMKTKLAAIEKLVYQNEPVNEEYER